MKIENFFFCDVDKYLALSPKDRSVRAKYFLKAYNELDVEDKLSTKAEAVVHCVDEMLRLMNPVSINSNTTKWEISQRLKRLKKLRAFLESAVGGNSG